MYTELYRTDNHTHTMQSVIQQPNDKLLKDIIQHVYKCVKKELLCTNETRRDNGNTKTPQNTVVMNDISA